MTAKLPTSALCLECLDVKTQTKRILFIFEENDDEIKDKKRKRRDFCALLLRTGVRDFLKLQCAHRSDPLGRNRVLVFW